MKIISHRLFSFFTIVLLCALTLTLKYITSFNLINQKLNLNKPNIVASKITGYVNDNNGALIYSIISESVFQFPDQKTLHLVNFTLSSFKPANGYIKSTIKGQDGYIEYNNKIAFIGQGAKLNMQNQEESKSIQIVGSNLNINLESMSINSKSYVEATQGKNKITAVGFSYDNKSELLQLNSQVRITYVP